MSDFTHRTVATNGIEMHVAECGDPDAKPIVFVHGFPELWRSWRKLMPVVADAGYRAVAPDMRGYGRTSAPEAVESYDAIHLTGDLCGLLDDLGADKALFVGHDWGAWVVWFMALLHPDRVDAVMNISVPYSQRGAHPPVEAMAQIFGDNFFYIVYFQEPGKADAELGADPRKTTLRFAWSVSGAGMNDSQVRPAPQNPTGFLDQMNDPPGPLGWFTDEDLEYFVGEFSRTGYTGPINWYRNIDRNWELTPQLDGAEVTQPVLFLAGTNDPVIRMVSPDTMKETVLDLRGIVLVEGAGHWIHMEDPEPVGEALLGFVKDVGY